MFSILVFRTGFSRESSGEVLRKSFDNFFFQRNHLKRRHSQIFSPKTNVKGIFTEREERKKAPSPSCSKGG